MSSKNEKTINQKIEELRQMVAWFESDDFDIEQAIERYQAAEKLASDIEKDFRRHCCRGTAIWLCGFHRRTVCTVAAPRLAKGF